MNELISTQNTTLFDTRDLDPENQETPIHFLRNWITPSNLFFIRNHFPYPSLTLDAFFLPVEGAVNRNCRFKK